eukprot:1524340-Amphidinium_carterae.1
MALSRQLASSPPVAYEPLPRLVSAECTRFQARSCRSPLHGGHPDRGNVHPPTQSQVMTMGANDTHTWASVASWAFVKAGANTNGGFFAAAACYSLRAIT